MFGIIEILETLKEIAGLSKVVAENQGQKIPLQKEQIEAKSEMKAQEFENKEAELQEDAFKDDYVPKVLVFSRCLSMRWEHHAVNQVKRFADAGHKITSINIEKEVKGEFWLYIRYIEGLCSTYYRVPVKQKKAALFLNVEK